MSIRPIYLKSFEELEATCASLVNSIQAAHLSHAEYLALNLKCLAEWEKDEEMAQECKRFALFLHASLTESTLDKNEFLVTLNAHRTVLKQKAQAPKQVHVEPNLEKRPPVARQHLVLLAPEGFRLGKLGNQLLWFGYSLQHVTRIEELLHLPESIEAILVFSRFNGADLPQLTRLKQLFSNRLNSIPLIFLSPKPSFEMQLSALRVGARTILAWPTAQDALIEAIQATKNEEHLENWHILFMSSATEHVSTFSKPLEKLGMRVTHITDPAQLIDCAIATRPDLLLIEAKLDYCEGTELASMVRQQVQLRSLPILLLCNDVRSAQHLSETAPADIDGTLLKPVQVSTLIEAVSRRIVRAHQRQANWKKDLLTDLPPRGALFQALEREYLHGQQSDSPFSVVLVKLKNMRKINELHGYAHGDFVLRATARFLKASLPKQAWLGRYGGASFVMLLPSHTQALAHARLKDMQEAYLRVEEFELTVPNGVEFLVFSPHTGESPSQMMQRLDDALLHLK